MRGEERRGEMRGDQPRRGDVIGNSNQIKSNQIKSPINEQTTTTQENDTGNNKTR